MDTEKTLENAHGNAGNFRITFKIYLKQFMEILRSLFNIFIIDLFFASIFHINVLF